MTTYFGGFMFFLNNLVSLYLVKIISLAIMSMGMIDYLLHTIISRRPNLFEGMSYCVRYLDGLKEHM